MLKALQLRLRVIGPSFNYVFRRDVLAETLWEYGEDALAERALELSERELLAVQRLAAWHYDHDPEPAGGPKLTGGRCIARAMIEVREGESRDTVRKRRRTRPQEQTYHAAYLESLASDGDPLPSTPVEEGCTNTRARAAILATPRGRPGRRGTDGSSLARSACLPQMAPRGATQAL